MSATPSPEDVLRLAALARIEVPAAELPKFVEEFDAILAYIGKLEALELSTGAAATPLLRNVMRPDNEPHEPGLYTEKLAEQFPERDGDYLSVKQIISYE